MRPVAPEMQRVQIRLDQRVLAAELLADQLLDRRHVHVEQRRQHAEIDDVLEQLPLPRVVVGAVADRGQRRADDVDVVAEPRRRHRLGRIVEQIAAGLDLGDVLVPGLRVHRDHHVDAAAPAEMAALADPHLEPGRQTLDVRREDVARARRDAHPQDRLGEQRVGARRAGAVDVGEFDDEVVDGGDCRRTGFRLQRHRFSALPKSSELCLGSTAVRPSRDRARSRSRVRWHRRAGSSASPRGAASASSRGTSVELRTTSIELSAAACGPGLGHVEKELAACPRRRSGSARRTGRNAGRHPRPWP